jgi:hypothetical protein
VLSAERDASRRCYSSVLSSSRRCVTRERQRALSTVVTSEIDICLTLTRGSNIDVSSSTANPVAHELSAFVAVCSLSIDIGVTGVNITQSGTASVANNEQKNVTRVSRRRDMLFARIEMIVPLILFVVCLSVCLSVCVPLADCNTGHKRMTRNTAAMDEVMRILLSRVNTARLIRTNSDET